MKLAILLARIVRIITVAILVLLVVLILISFKILVMLKLKLLLVNASAELVCILTVWIYHLASPAMKTAKLANPHQRTVLLAILRTKLLFKENANVLPTSTKTLMVLAYNATLLAKLALMVLKMVALIVLTVPSLRMVTPANATKVRP